MEGQPALLITQCFFLNYCYGTPESIHLYVFRAFSHLKLRKVPLRYSSMKSYHTEIMIKRLRTLEFSGFSGGNSRPGMKKIQRSQVNINEI